MSAEAELRKYCKRKDINPDGQFIEQDGYLFIDGYLIGERDANKRASKFMRLSKEASRQQNQRIKELEDDLCFKVSEAHVVTMGKLMALQEAVKAVLDEELSGVSVHPCDEHSEDIKARGMPPVYQELYKAVKMQADNKPLSIHFNADSVTIEGITYSNDMFRQFGGLMPLNQTFRLVQRSTGISSGSITVEYVDQEKK